MIVFGGHGCGGVTDNNDGGMYNPLTNTWTPMTKNGAPSPRFAPAMVWTGSRVLLWGGGCWNAPGCTGPNNDGFLFSEELYKKAWQRWFGLLTSYGALRAEKRRRKHGP